MKTGNSGVRWGGIAAGVLVVAAGWSASAQDTNVAARLAELERQVAVLAEEAEHVRFGDVFVKPGEGAHGMGPAASKVYSSESGVTIGGYGEALYQNFDGDKTDEADFVRFVLYVGHKFSERWVFNSELEVEHASTDKEGHASVEFAYLDYLWTPALNARAGMVLVPVGLLTELHEPTIYLGARRPDTESRIIPSTWRENGVGLFGDLGPLRYKAYVVTGLKGEDFAPSGLRGGRQKGSEAEAEDLAAVARLDWDVAPGLLLGGSAYRGDSGQSLDVAAATTIVETHADLRRGPVLLRALATIATVDDVADLNRLLAEPGENGEPPADAAIDSIGEQMVGWYVEGGLDVAALAGASTLAVIPFVRYEEYNTQDEVPAGFASSPANDVQVATVGVNVKPLAELVFKADYQFYENEADTGIDQFNLAMGYVF